MGIGSKLSKLIEVNDTNANELANKIGVSPQTIYSIIKRDSKKADIEVLLRIADVFGVSAEYFVYDEKPSVVKEPAFNYFTTSEREHIKKYRALDSHGKKIVDLILNEETNRMTEAAQKLTATPVRLIPD